MLAWISGPTGAGKTTIAKALSRKGWGLVPEVLPEGVSPFKESSILNMRTFQENIIDARFRNWNQISSLDKPILFDRSIEEDINVFCQIHFESGLITESELRELTQRAQGMLRQIPPPDMIIFVSADLDTLRERMRALGHPKVLISSLVRQCELYSNWIMRQTTQILRLDTSRCSESALDGIIR